MDKYSQVITLVATLFSVLGLGSFLTIFDKDLIDRRNFIIQEKIKVYTGYLEALKLCQTKTSHENSQNAVF